MHITDAAKEYIQAVMAEQEVYTIRVVLAGTGCGGPKLALSLDEETKENDTIETINGLQVIFDDVVKEEVKNLILDVETNSSGQEKLVFLGPTKRC